MDFAELLKIAASNNVKAQAESSIKRYSTTFPAAKKPAKSDALSQRVQRFLVKKKHEEKQKELEAQRNKAELLALRSQNKKTNSKTKTVASDTRHQDSVREELRSHEVMQKKVVEHEHQKKQLGDEKKGQEEKNKLPPQPSCIKFDDLMKLASQKQNEPVKLPKVSDTDSRPLTQKQRDELCHKEQARKKSMLKKQSEQAQKSKISRDLSSSTKGNLPSSKRNSTGELHALKSEKVYKPVAHISKMGKETASLTASQKHQDHDVAVQDKPANVHSNSSALRASGKFKQNLVDRTNLDATRKGKPHPVTAIGVQKGKARSDLKVKNNLIPSKSGLPKPLNTSPSEKVPGKVISSGNEKRFVERTPHGRTAPANGSVSAKTETKRSDIPPVSPSSSCRTSKHNKSKTFHINPYMDEPLQVFDQRKQHTKQMKRRLESDDEDDGDIEDFIDDGPCDGGEVDYSRYIREMFPCNQREYNDDDDDDIIETSYAQQIREETRSAKLGYMEDLEDIRKEKEEKKRQMMKKKKRRV